MFLGTAVLEAKEVGALIVSDDVTVDNLTRDELAGIFLGKKSNWDDGKRINIGYTLHTKEKTEIFFDELVGQDHRRFKKYWLKKVFSGYGVAPRLFKTPEQALEFVKAHEGCIMFVTVDDTKDLEGFKLVAVDGLLEF